MWKFFRASSACLLLLLTGEPAVAAPPRVLMPILCAQHPVQFPGLVAALNHYMALCSAMPACLLY